jgi:uncharacterized protein (DUF3820 family)
VSATEIGFGKYKGKPLADVPTDYLQWLEGEGIRSPKLAEAVATELKRRASGAGAAPAPSPAPPLEAALRQLDAAVAAVHAAVKR